MDLKCGKMQQKQKISDALAEFERVVEKAKKELISDIKLNQNHNQDAIKKELIELKMKLHNEKIANSVLNEKISKLTEEKNRMKLSLDFAQESKEDVERQLREENKKKKQLKAQLQRTAQKRGSKQLPTSTSNSLDTPVDHLLTSSTRKVNVSQEPDSAAKEENNNNIVHNGGAQVSSSATSIPINGIRIKAEKEGEQHVNNRIHKEVEEPQIPLVSTSNNIQQQEQYFDSLSHTEQVGGRERKCRPVESSCIVKSEVILDEAKSPQSSSPFKGSPKPSSSKNTSHRKWKNSPSESSKTSGSSSRKRTCPSSLSSSHAEPSSKTAKQRKKSGESQHASTSNSLKTIDSLLHKDSILKVPELYRINYGFSNGYTLDLCPHARDFWYDFLHNTSTKYLIRFFDDEDGHCVTKRITVKEQIGLAEPLVFHLKLKEIVQLFEENKKKPGGIRIFLDVRDWNIFSHNVSQFFHDFGSFVTHFSFGRNLYSMEEVGGDQLVEFILKRLPNLEYLAISDAMLKRLGGNFSLSSSAHDLFLRKLKILRLLNVRLSVSTPFIMAILRSAPNLSSVYGLPVHLLEKMEKIFLKSLTRKSGWLIKDKGCLQVCMDKVKSVEVFRNLYSKKDSTGVVPYDYRIDLTTLLRLRPALEELDTRVFFMLPIFRQVCLDKLSEILQLSGHSLKVLRIQPLHPYDIDNLKIPRLEKCDTLQLDMTLLPNRDQRYFPRGMELQDFFPNLKSVEIILDYKSGDGGLNTVENCLKGKMASDLFDAHFPVDTFSPFDPVKTVQRLQIVNFTPINFMGKFQKRFPFITILGLNQTLSVVSQVLPHCIRLWPELKQLVLEVNFFGDVKTNLDSAFTGIPENVCKSLEKLKDEDIEGSIDKYQKKQAIGHLKNLTLLKIVLFNRGPLGSFGHSSLMTPVSAIYGFGKERMPNLKVIIGFDERVTSHDRFDIVRNLEPMMNFVTIDE